MRVWVSNPIVLIILVVNFLLLEAPVYAATKPDTWFVRDSGYVHTAIAQTSLPCTLKGTPSRTKGRIDLGWGCTSKSSSGWFLVEQSVNGKSWSRVSACGQAASASTKYSCSVTRLTSGRTYSFRLCLVPSDSTTQCGTNKRTPTVTVKAP